MIRVVLCALFICATTQSATYQLMWQDEFNQFSSGLYNRWDINRNNWNVEVVNNSHNNEIQQYRDNRDNVRIEVDTTDISDGILVLEARKQNNTQNLGAWTSGRINSLNKVYFTYGKVEVSAKLPGLLGSWPAIWMLGNNFNSVGWPSSGEIDIMEMGRNTGWNYINSTVHWQYNGHASYGTGNYQSGNPLLLSSASTAFHIYTLEWTPTSIKTYVDGNYLWSINLPVPGIDPFDNPFFIVLNNAMGGDIGGTVDASGSSSRFEIDYVKVYQSTDYPQSTLAIPEPAGNTLFLTAVLGLMVAKKLNKKEVK